MGPFGHVSCLNEYNSYSVGGVTPSLDGSGID